MVEVPKEPLERRGRGSRPPRGDVTLGLLERRRQLVRRRRAHVARGEVPLEDVAGEHAAAPGCPDTIGKTFVVVSGDTPVDEAVAAL